MHIHVGLQRDCACLILSVHVSNRLQAAALRFAAWISSIDLFDEGLFRLSRSEAVGLDPQCRRLLENVWAAMQVDSHKHLRCFVSNRQPGLAPGAPKNCLLSMCFMLQAATLGPATATAASTGTYVGCVWSEYMILQESHGVQPSVAALTGSGLTFLAGRVSYTFGLQGECLPWGPAVAAVRPGMHGGTFLKNTEILRMVLASSPVEWPQIVGFRHSACRTVHELGHSLLFFTGCCTPRPSSAAQWRGQCFRLAPLACTTVACPVCAALFVSASFVFGPESLHHSKRGHQHDVGEQHNL